MAVYMILGVVGLSGGAPAPLDALERALHPRAAAQGVISAGAGRAAFAAGVARRADGRAPARRPGEAVFETDRVMVLADAYLYRGENAGPAPPAAARIAEAYARQGEAGLDRIEGDFAFAVYDKIDDRLVVRRDAFGVRPLYIAHKTGEWYAFATLPELLLEAGLAGLERDWAASRRQIASLSTGPDATLLKDVARLRPGRQAAVQAGAVSVSRRHTPAPAPDAPEDYARWSAELKRRFEAAIARRLPPRGVVGAHLTSGLDSAGVALAAARLLPDDQQHIDAYCFGASQEARAFTVDETDLAADVAASSNRVGFTAVRAEPGREFGLVEACVDRLRADPGPHHRAAESAAMNGAEVFLIGLGGDQSISYTGWGVGAELLRLGRWKAARAYFRAERAKGKSRIRVAAHMAAPLLGPPNLAYRIYKALAGTGQTRDTVRSMSGLKRRRLREISLEYPEFGPDTVANQARQFESGQVSNQLENLARIGLAVGVRYTFPLLDTRLVAWSMTCRPEFHHRDGLARAPMRDLLRDVLPDSTRLLPKNARLPVPELSYRIAENKAQYLERLDRLEADVRLHAWYDFKRIRRELEAIESPETVRARLAEQAAHGRQARDVGQGAAFMAVSRMEFFQRWLDEEARAPGAPDPGPDAAR